MGLLPLMIYSPRVEAEFEQPQSKSPSHQKINPNHDNTELQELVSQVKAEFAKKRRNYQGEVESNSHSNSSSTSPPLDDLLTQVRAEFEQKPPSQSSRAFNSFKPKNSSTKKERDEDFFAQVKSKFEQRKQTQATQNYQQSVDEVRLAEQKRQRKQQSLLRQAKKWLSNLDPHSEEGLWFEEFAYSYPSRLEAAIDYVEALHEVRY